MQFFLDSTTEEPGRNDFPVLRLSDVLGTSSSFLAHQVGFALIKNLTQNSLALLPYNPQNNPQNDFMPLSHYVKTYPYEERPGYLLLYSTRKTSMILLKETTFQEIETGGLSPADEAALSKLGMIVPDITEEKRSVAGLIDNVNTKNPILNVIVVLNLDCNFSCIYCYEGDMKGKLYMSDETAAGLIDFVKKKFTNEKKSLIIDFYGGEPLLSIGLIRTISTELRALAGTRGASYSFTLISNGSLFKRRVAEELVSLGLKSIKITLDGPAETHNVSRPFKSGTGSFDTIIANIRETCDLLKIGIGGNFDRNNYQKFPLLFDSLSREGLTPDRISIVKFAPVLNGPEGEISPGGYREGCISINEPWLLDADAFLQKEILKKGYNTSKPMPPLCMVETTNSCVVNFDGVIYKCPAFIGKDGFAAGNVRTGMTEYASSYKPGLWKNNECRECAYLPLCFGGCRYMTFLRDGKIDNVDCKKAFLNASLETTIKQHIKYKLKCGASH